MTTSERPARLREIVYLDRERINSYLSQLAGGLTVQETSQDSTAESMSGSVKASIKVLEFQVGGEKATGAESVITRIPAHAILSTFEQILEDQSMLVDARGSTILPGQLCRLTADATFESWGMLASLADSIQGIAAIAAKIYSATKGEATLQTLKTQTKELERHLKRTPGSPESKAALARLVPAVSKINLLLSIVEGRYIDDAKEVIKLFFQDQNHVRFAVGDTNFVGLLRAENLVSSTMAELLFTYGSRPMGSFGAIFYIAELGSHHGLVPATLAARFADLASGEFPLSNARKAIREVGTLLLDCAEELRRPEAEDAVFIVPLAVFRDIRIGDQSRSPTK